MPAQDLPNAPAKAVRRGIDSSHGIVEVEIPASLDGKSLATSACARNTASTSSPAPPRRRAVAPDAESGHAFTVGGTPHPKTLLRAGDRLIIFGKLSAVDRFTEGHADKNA